MKKIYSIVFLLSFSVLLGQPPGAQQNKDIKFVFEPDSLYLNVGETGSVTIKLVNAKGELIKNPFYVYGTPRRSLESQPRISDSTGVAKVTIKPYKPGKLSLAVRSISQKREDRVYDRMTVQVPFPPLDRIVLNGPSKTLYAGTTVRYTTEVYDKANLLRDDANVKLKSSKTNIAEFDDYGNLVAKKAGKVKLTASVDNVSESLNVTVIKNPVNKISLDADKDKIRTGDVLQLSAKAVDRSGRQIKDVPIVYSFTGKADYGIGLPAAGLINSSGKFVADTPGLFTVTAQSGGFIARKTIKVVPRNVKKTVKVVGHGTVSDFNTSDLWVWPGVGKHKGKDFAATGTWGANGDAYFWDVTDPSKMAIIDTITVDARTVNDVKISEDGRVGVITREGASNRKNGFVVLDVTDPYNVKITAEFNDDMTGGVHNAFIYDNHVYAVNNGRKYDIINIDDPSNPFRVGVFELDTPGHSIHDVWIENGIAYSSNWSDGVVAVDIGGAKFDEADRSKSQFNPLLSRTGKGSPSNPVKLASMEDPTGRNHAAFPFLSKSTGNFYIIAGDENFPWGVLAPKGQPSNPRGGYHFLNFSDPDNPKEEAIYEVPEAGSHNLWVFDDILIAGNYQGGLRVVDISGELLGDIYKQGREIGLYVPYNKEGKIPNAPMVWGAQPYKDYIFFADMNSGLYCIQLVDGQPSARRIPG